MDSDDEDAMDIDEPPKKAAPKPATTGPAAAVRLPIASSLPH